MMIQSFTSEGGMKLTKALLLYEGGAFQEGCTTEYSTVAASIHDVARDPKSQTDAPMLMPGSPLTTEAMNEIYRKLAGGQKQSRSLLAPNLLCADAGRLIWHLPSARRLIFFKTNDKKFDAELNGKQVLHPALLFCAEGRTLYVFALSNDVRPNGKTSLFHAPYFNMYERGSMCAGSSRVPKSCNPSDIPAWEKLFFETNFSHSNGRSKLCAHPGGHNALWRELARSRGRGVHKTFPAKYLLSAKRKVEDLLNGRL